MRLQTVFTFFTALTLLASTTAAVSLAEEPESSEKPRTEFRILQPIESPAAQDTKNGPAPASPPVSPIIAKPTDLPVQPPAEDKSAVDDSSPSDITEDKASQTEAEPATNKVEPFQGRKVASPGEGRAACDPIRRKIQQINQTPLVFRFVMLPRRALLERQHRACIRPQSYREREFLESIPKP